ADRYMVSRCVPSRRAWGPRGTVASRRPTGGEGQEDGRRLVMVGADTRRISRPSGGARMAGRKGTARRDRNDAPASWGLHLASMGAVVVEGLMRAGGVV